MTSVLCLITSPELRVQAEKIDANQMIVGLVDFAGAEFRRRWRVLASRMSPPVSTESRFMRRDLTDITMVVDRSGSMDDFSK
jgi:hypothetical protein